MRTGDSFVMGLSIGLIVATAVCLALGPHKQVLNVESEIETQRQEIMQARRSLLDLPGQCRAWIKRRRWR